MTQTRIDELLRVAAPLLDPAQLIQNEKLALLVQLRDELESIITLEVISARLHRTSWARIGKALGLKATTAQKRYRMVAPVERTRTQQGVSK